MSSPTENDPNPYQAPATDLRGPGFSAQAGIADALLKKFRAQILALGALWIIFGVLAGVLCGLVLAGTTMLATPSIGNANVLLSVIGGLAAAWVALGVLTCLKTMWAVYAGLVLCYVSVLGNLLTRNLCAVGIMIVVIVQAHRVIGFANKLRAAGVPLTAKPGKTLG